MKIRRAILAAFMLALMLVMASPAFAAFDLTAKKWSGSFVLTNVPLLGRISIPTTLKFNTNGEFDISLGADIQVMGTYTYDDMVVSLQAYEGEIDLPFGFGTFNTQSLSGDLPIKNSSGKYSMVLEKEQQSTGIIGKLSLSRTEIKATSISLVLPEIEENKTIVMGVTPEYKLDYTLKPATADSWVKFKTSSKSVATVSSTGVVTPVATGKAGKKTVVITAYTSNGKRKTVTLTIIDPTIARSISLNAPSTYPMMEGTKFQLVTTPNPVTATSKVTYKSSVPGIASVDENGLVTAHATSAKKGSRKYTSTVISATCNGHVKSITVKVLNQTSKNAIIIYDGTGGGNRLLPSISMSVGDVRNLVAHVLPSDTLEAATWTTSNKRYVSVDKQTGEITGVRAGSATITAKIGTVRSTIKVTVTK